ncbi:MAG: putative cytokinetic ring protein SteA [Bacillota bacterium]
MPIVGRVRKDSRTKRLISRLFPGDIALLDHEDLDEVAARELVSRRVAAVLNVKSSLTCRYPNPGPQVLLDAGIPQIDQLGPELLERLADGDRVSINRGQVIKSGQVIARGRRLNPRIVQEAMMQSRANLTAELESFLENTLEHAWKERALILGGMDIPDGIGSFRHRHALVVVRGQNYREDLAMIRPYVGEMRPVLVGVDGGADALLEVGLVPEYIVGDMDSVSDRALRSGACLVVHAYPDGRAPARSRLQELGLDHLVVAAPGTSEDVALMICYEREAELIVAVGTHSNIVDFLEKGRPGMASTFLVRLKVGSILVDARGINRLYRGRLRARYFLEVLAASLVPAAVVASIGAPSRNLMRLVFLRLRLWLGL